VTRVFILGSMQARAVSYEANSYQRTPVYTLSTSLVIQYPMEVGSLSRGVMLPRKVQRLSTSLQCSLRFFHPPIPAIPSACLATRFPQAEYLARRMTGLPRSASVPVRLRSRLSAGGATSASGELGTPELVHLLFSPSLSASLACHS
jgi:hypothetical protein